MKIFSFLKIIFFSITLLIGNSLHSMSQFGGPAAGGMPQMDLSGLSPEEREMMEMINGMSPEQQQQFMVEIMSELEKEADKLPPAEKEKFLSDFWSEVEKEAQQLEEKIKPANENVAPIIMEPTPAPTPAKGNKSAPKPAAKSKVDEAINTIDSLLVKLEKILNKTALIPDIAIKVSDWLKKGEITPSFANWQTLKNQIDLFIQQLSKMKDRDPKTRDYKYMGELVKNEVILNNLARVESVLRSSEGDIELPEFGSTTISTKSSSALKKALSGISEAFYRLGLPAALDSITEKYEPIAKKHSEEKAKSIQEAQQRNAQQRPSNPMISAGASAPTTTYQPGAAKYPSAAPSSLDQFESLFGGPSIGSTSSANDRGRRPALGGQDNVPQPAGKSASTKPALPEIPKAPTPVKKEDEKKKEKEEEKKKRVEEDKRMEKALDTLASSFDGLSQALVDGGFKNIQTQVLSKAPLNTQVANMLQPISSRAQNALGKARDVQNRFKKLDADQKKYYKTDIDSILVQTNAVESVIKQINAIRDMGGASTADKKWAFFGGEQAPDNMALLTMIAPPLPEYTLYTLEAQLTELLNVLKSIK